MCTLQADDFGWVDLGVDVIGKFNPDGSFSEWKFSDRPKLPAFVQREPFIAIDSTTSMVYIKGLYSEKFTDARMLAIQQGRVKTINEDRKIINSK